MYPKLKIRGAPLTFLLVLLTAPVPAVSAEQRPIGVSRDLEGMWTGGTLTPIERPPELANKTHFDPSELQQQQELSTKRFWEAGHRAGDVGRDNDAFLQQDLKLLPSGQTSLVVDPPDGKVRIRPEAETRRDYNLSAFDTYESMSQYDRCITRQPMALFPVAYNNAYQIVQTRTHIVIVAEMVHDARIVAIDGGAHVDGRIRSMSGDSRGHWEGNTLVVESTNFDGRGWLFTSMNATRLRGIPYSQELRLIERFTRIDATTLQYEVTIEDPKNYERPWTMKYPWTRDEAYRMYEYACHEGNSAVQAMMGGARAQGK